VISDQWRVESGEWRVESGEWRGAVTRSDDGYFGGWLDDGHGWGYCPSWTLTPLILR
jgi:hypothetical protein